MSKNGAKIPHMVKVCEGEAREVSNPALEKCIDDAFTDIFKTLNEINPTATEVILYLSMAVAKTLNGTSQATGSAFESLKKGFSELMNQMKFVNEEADNAKDNK